MQRLKDFAQVSLSEKANITFFGATDGIKYIKTAQEQAKTKLTSLCGSQDQQLQTASVFPAL